MVLLALIFVFGAWLLQQLPVLPSLWWALSLPALALAVYLTKTLWPQKLIHSALFGLLALLLGLFWAACCAHTRLADTLPKEWERRDINIVGVIASMPQSHDRGQRFEFDVEHVLTPEATVPKRISLAAYEGGFNQSPTPLAKINSPYQVGQRWQLTVRLKRPHTTLNPHGFDFEAWSLERNIRATGYIRKSQETRLTDHFVYRPAYVVEKLRAKIRTRMMTVLAEKPYAGVLRALAIGDESGILQDDWQTFLRTGTNHLMSISGLHITMLAGLAFSLTQFLWRRSERAVLALPARKMATLVGALVALAYALIAGFSIPTQRTLYMLSVFAIALWLDRHVSIARVLAYALLAVVILDPWAVLAAGFWLSFGAVAVIAYALNGRLRKPHWLRDAVSTQWAVTLGLVPFLLILFQQVSIVSPLANALAIPIISLIVVPLTLAGSVLPFDWILLLAHEVVSLCMWVMHWLADSSLSVWQQQAPPGWTFVLAVMGVLWLLLPAGFPLRWLGVLAMLPMFLLQNTPPRHGEMQVTVLDVGQGLAVIVRTQHHTLLYDTGATYSSQHDSGGRVILPYLRATGVRQLDRLIVSHDDNDHSGGLVSVLSQIPVAEVLSSLPENSPLLENASHTRCHVDQAWEWEGVRFEMIYPELDSYDRQGIKDNDRSCVLRITSSHGRILLTGDIERNAERALLQSEYALKADVLVAPHHGSKTSSIPAFVDAVQPSAVIFTAGYLNRFHHPHPSVLNRYERLGALIYRSDHDGAVLMDFTAEKGIEIRRWRQHARRYWHQSFETVKPAL